MFKKILAIATVMCVIPMMASAATSWKLGTRAMSQGGVIDSRNMTNQTVINGGIFKSYTTNIGQVTVLADPGFKISKILENGFTKIDVASPYTSENTGTSNFSIQATFKRLPFSITATAGVGGSVDKTKYPVVYSGLQSPLKSFIFTPNPGQFVSSVTVTGADATAQNLNAVTGDPVTLPATVGVKVKTNIYQVGTENVTVVGVFGGVATPTPATPASNCNACHTTQGVGQAAYASYSAGSAHKNAGMLCQSCHIGAASGGHPGTLSVSTCTPCHIGATSIPVGDPHSCSGATTACTVCHATNSKVIDFYATKHWRSNLETGPEFANQMDSVVNTDGTVTYPGTFTNGVLNANDSYTTTENGTVVTCAYRCHFRPGFGPYSTVNNAAGTTNYLKHRKATNGLSNPYNTAMVRPGGDACEACHNRTLGHGVAPTYQNSCLVCHSGTKVNGTTKTDLALVTGPNDVVTGHGAVPYEFFNSKHWQNNVEFDDATMRNQLETNVDSRGNVTKLGTFVNGQLNANDSYYTEELGSNGKWAVVTCAYRCHFRPGMGPDQNVGTVLANGKSTGNITYTDITGKYGPAGTVYSRPGGDACMACHDSHGLEATAQSTCYTCHAGSVTSHGWSVAAFEKSSHFTGTYAKLDGMDKEACLACHNAHSTEASFVILDTTSKPTAAGCQKCHTPGSPYSIFNADGTGSAPHFQTNAPGADGYYPTGSYDGGGATCVDCHYHNNTINADWAKGGHASTTSLPLVTSAGDNWNRGTKRGANLLKPVDAPNVVIYNGDYTQQAQVSDCQRCHTAAGFKLFYDSAFKNVSTAREGFTTSAPITCDACHVPKTLGTLMYNGKVRPLATGLKSVKTYVGNAKYLTNITDAVTTFSSFSSSQGTYGNSKVCIPCHAGRGTGALVKASFAAGTVIGDETSADAPRNILRIGTAVYAHFASAAGVVNGSSAYEFTAPAVANTHITAGTKTQGSCIGCHMSSAEGHSLESVTFDGAGKIIGFATTACTTCHGVTAPALTPADAQTAKDNFEAALNMLRNLLLERGFDGLQAEIDARPGERVKMNMALGYNAYVAAGGTLSIKDFAERNTGACFNWWQFGKTVKDGKAIILGDPSAYVHNPTYTRQVIRDTMDWLDDFQMNNSITAAQIDDLATHAVKTYGGVADGVAADPAKAKSYFGL